MPRVASLIDRDGLEANANVIAFHSFIYRKSRVQVPGWI